MHFLCLPDIIPTHFNDSGKADNYGNKSGIFILPVLATILYLGLTQLSRHPRIFNYPLRITVDNARQQYTIATRMIRFLKLSVLVIFTLVILFTYLTTMGFMKDPGSWFLPLAVAVCLAPTIFLLIRSFKIKPR